MRDVTLGIHGMHGCAAQIKTLFERERGVREADVSFAEGRARVRINEHATSLERLVELVENAGFDVTSGS